MNEIKALIERLKELDYKFYGCELCKREADIVIPALEKTLAKKPEQIRERHNFRGDVILKVGSCPECDSELDSSYRYCKNCGSKLDWSVKDE